MKDSWIGQVGIWGQRHYQYLKENKQTTVNVMRMNGSLKQYLREVDEQAEEMVFQLVRQMAKEEGVTETLKSRIRCCGFSGLTRSVAAPKKWFC